MQSPSESSGGLTSQLEEEEQLAAFDVFDEEADNEEQKIAEEGGEFDNLMVSTFNN